MKDELEKELKLVQDLRKTYEDHFSYQVLTSEVDANLKDLYLSLVNREDDLRACLMILRDIKISNLSYSDAWNREVEKINDIGYLFSFVPDGTTYESLGNGDYWESSAGSCGWYNEGEHGWNDSGCSGG